MRGLCEATTTLRARIQMSVNDFAKLMQEFPNGRAISSEQIKQTSYSWRLCVFPNGQVAASVGCVTIMVFLLGPHKLGQKKVPATLSLYLLDKDDKQVRLLPNNTTCVFQLPHHGCGRYETKQKEVLPELRADGSLKVVAEIEFAPVADEDDKPTMEVWTRDLTDTLLAQGLCSDCTVKVGDNSFKAHKAVLVAHVSEFRAAICDEEGRDKTRHSNERHVFEITGFPVQSVKMMLHYLYTGSVLAEKMPECCEDVFRLAERYSLPELKRIALSFMAAQVDETNLVKMVLTASKESSNVLLQGCAHYIAEHSDAVLASDEWKKLKSEKTDLTNKLLEMTQLNTSA